MHHVEQLRCLLPLVNPAHLTAQDRLALLDLIYRCLEGDTSTVDSASA